MRVSVLCQNYRYAKKTQISLGPKKYRHVGEITTISAINSEVQFYRKKIGCLKICEGIEAASVLIHLRKCSSQATNSKEMELEQE